MTTISPSKIFMHNVRFSAIGPTPEVIPPPAPGITPATFATGSSSNPDGYVVVDADNTAAKGYKVLPGRSTGKYYWEFTSYASAYATETIGIVAPDEDPRDFFGSRNWRFYWNGDTYQGRTPYGNVRGGFYAGSAGGRTVMMALSFNPQIGSQLFIGVDGEWKWGLPEYSGIAPGLRIGYEGLQWSPSYTISPDGPAYTRKSEFNFGQKPMKYPVPEGYTAGWPA